MQIQILDRIQQLHTSFVQQYNYQKSARLSTQILKITVEILTGVI